MKQSEINRAWQEAGDCFARTGWALPPEPRWDITDFGLGRFAEAGLVLINLAEEPEYCEKLMWCRHQQQTPMHCHRAKKEDIICRWGRLAIELWAGDPRETPQGRIFTLKRSGREFEVRSGEILLLNPGERVTLVPGVWHAFWADSDECVIGEVSTANDDTSDNFFVDPDIGRFPLVESDEPPALKLISQP